MYYLITVKNTNRSKTYRKAVNYFLNSYYVLEYYYGHDHAHILIKTNYTLNLRKIHAKFSCYIHVRFVKPNKSDIERVIRYINGHKRDRGDKLDNRLEDRVSKLERDVAEIKEMLKQLLGDRKSVNDIKLERIEVNLSRMTVIIQKARKGIALRIKFPAYIKPNNKGEYFVVLQSDDVKALAIQLMNAYRSFTDNKSRTGSNVKIVRGGELG